MQITSFNNPMEAVLDLEKQIESVDSLNASIIIKLEALIQNWKQYPQESLNQPLSDELLKLSNRISQFNTEEAVNLAGRIKMISEASLLQALSKTDLLKKYCPWLKTPQSVHKELQLKNFVEHQIGMWNLSLSERMALAIAIAGEGASEAEYLVKNLDKLKLEGTGVLDYFALCEKVSSYGWDQLDVLIKNFGKVDFESGRVSDPFALWSGMVEKGEWAAVVTANHFDQLGLGELGLNQRLSLISKICLRRTTAAYSLHQNFGKLGLIKEIREIANIQERLSLCKEIAAINENIATALIENFAELGFGGEEVSLRLDWCKEIGLKGEKPFRAFLDNLQAFGLEEAAVPERLGFVKMIVSLGEWATEMLIPSLHIFGIRETGEKEYLPLYIEMLEQGEDAAVAMAQNFKLFGLNEEERSVHLNFILQIAQQGVLAAEALAKNFEQLGLDEFTASDRLDVINEIISQGEEAGIALLENFDKLGIDREDTIVRLNICEQILTDNAPAAKALAENFEKIRLHENDVTKRLALIYDIISQGELAAESVAANFGKFALQELDVRERLELCKNIIAQGEWAGAALIQNFENLGLEDADASERLSLFNSMLTAGENTAAMALATNFEKLGYDGKNVSRWHNLCKDIAAQGSWTSKVLATKLQELKIAPSEKRAILLELLIPPHYMQDELEAFDFSSPIQPLISLLWKKEGDLINEDYDALEQFLNVSGKVRFLLPIYEMKRMNPVDLARFTLWAAYAAGVLNDLDEDNIETIQASGILKNIIDYRNPHNRFGLLKQLSLLPREELHEIPVEAKKEKWSILPWLLLSRLKQPGFTNVSTIEILNQINSIAGFKDTARLNHLVQFLLALVERGPYEEEEAKRIAETLLTILSRQTTVKPRKGQAPQKKVIEPISTGLQTLTNILQIFGREKFLNCMMTENDYDSFFLNQFQDLFKVDEMEAFGDLYAKTFGNFRNPNAIYTYLRSVKKLAEDERNEVLPLLSSYVNGVLSGTFPEIRYNATNSPHLKTVFESRAGLKESWTDIGSPEEIVETEATEDAQINYKKYFIQKILTDKHLNTDEYPQLRDYLEGKLNETKLEAEAVGLKDQFEYFSIELCEGRITAGEFINKVKTLKIPLAEFQNDLKNLAPQKSTGKYVVSETDDPCDLLLIGTEVNGSCQRVDGSPDLTKSLIGYLMNGEILSIVIKREGFPEIVARSILRLMWDSEKKAPVLLLERPYSNIQNEFVPKAILQRAKQKAEKMGITLVSKEVGDGIPYTGPVRFLGGLSHFTYSDASGGVREGRFLTENCHVLFEPE